MNFLLIFCFIRKYALRKKNFSEALKNAPKNVTTKLEGERGKALVGGPLKKAFFAASLTILNFLKLNCSATDLKRTDFLCIISTLLKS